MWIAYPLPPDSLVEVLTSHTPAWETVFRDRIFREVIKNK